ASIADRNRLFRVGEHHADCAARRHEVYADVNLRVEEVPLHDVDGCAAQQKKDGERRQQNTPCDALGVLAHGCARLCRSRGAGGIGISNVHGNCYTRRLALTTERRRRSRWRLVAPDAETGAATQAASGCPPPLPQLYHLADYAPTRSHHGLPPRGWWSPGSCRPARAHARWREGAHDCRLAGWWAWSSSSNFIRSYARRRVGRLGCGAINSSASPTLTSHIPSQAASEPSPCGVR